MSEAFDIDAIVRDLQNRKRFYLLLADGPVAVSVEEAIEYWEANPGYLTNNQLAFTDCDDYVVSTVFLGCDMALFGPPLLFETMIFSNDGDMYKKLHLWSRRYTTQEEAMAGHEKVAQAVRIGENPDEVLE